MMSRVSFTRSLWAFYHVFLGWFLFIIAGVSWL